MTAPAEDPRGGEAAEVRETIIGRLSEHMSEPYAINQADDVLADLAAAGFVITRPPAAGRGDTDSGGEAEQLEALRHGYLMDDVSVAATRPAGDHVDPAEIVRQRSLGWPDMHPEDNCHTCGRPNPVWFADTAEWQTATDSTGDGGGILCPSCFCALWKQKTGKTAIIWRLSIGGGRDARPAGDRAQPTEEEHSTDLTPGVVWTDAQLAVVRDLTARAVRAQAAVERVEALADERDKRHASYCCTVECPEPDGRHGDPTDPIHISELAGAWSDNPPSMREHRTIPCPGTCTCPTGPDVAALRRALGGTT